MLNRRFFLGGAGAALSSFALLPRVAHAATGSDRKFVFVFAQGGWDPTRVLADGFDVAGVDMDPGADRATIGGLSFVDHPARPSVRSFFEANARRSIILNGVMVRSIAHDICTMIAMTGGTSGLTPDWPAILGSRERARYTLPHLVLAGPSFPGDLGVAVARTGSAGQLDALVDGTALANSDLPAGGPNGPAEQLLDRWLARRSAARLAGARSAHERRLLGDFDEATADLTALKDLQYVMNFAGGAGVGSQAAVAAQALSGGVSRCVTLSDNTSWDTHANNDALQSPLWDSLYAGLAELMAILDATPGETEPTLADETTVVVLSEMGRTPALNEFSGKDHWPYTSMMIIGGGLTGGRVVGGFDSAWYGRPVDPVSGEIAESGQVLSAEAVGATLLALADIDPGPYVSGVSPIMGILE